MISCIKILNEVTSLANERQHEVWLHYFDVKDHLKDSDRDALHAYRLYIQNTLIKLKEELQHSEVTQFGQIEFNYRYRIAFIDRIESEISALDRKISLEEIEAVSNTANRLLGILHDSTSLYKSQESYDEHGII